MARKSFESVLKDSRPANGNGPAYDWAGANEGANDPNTWGQGPSVPGTPPSTPHNISDAPPSSSVRIAAEFMAQGRPAARGFEASGYRSEDMSPVSIEIKTPQYGTGFAEWAVNGYNLEGRIQSGPKGNENYHPEPGKPQDLKVNIATPVTHKG